MSSVDSGVSVAKGLDPADVSTDTMKEKKTKRESEWIPDFDLEKLFRGEVGPNVADEIAAK